MKIFRLICPLWLFVSLLVVLVLPIRLLRAAGMVPTLAKTTSNAAVTIIDNGQAWTLDNGIVKATINKSNGAMSSFIYHGINTMRSGGGYWEQTPQGAPELSDTVTIDPEKNGGARAEVAIKGITGGTHMLSPGAPGGGTYVDIEIRYALSRGDSGIYTYAIYTHPASYRSGGVGPESRYIARLNQTFDWITVDTDRNMLECAPTDWGTGVVVHAKEQRIMSKGVYKNSVEHKYNYSGVEYKTPAYGWSSTKEHIGIWFINPTVEYLSGGPTKNELDAHYGDNADPDPIILDYWEGGHYDTGARAYVAEGTYWTKVVGPIFVYVNSLEKAKPISQSELATLAATEGNPTVPTSWHENATALWQDALRQAKKETAKWPYSWVNGVDYPHEEQRGTVSGQIVLDDPLAPKTGSSRMRHLMVGLEHPDNGVSWIHDARYYQFWTDGSADGSFTITKVRPGNYTLHAFADGVLGDFAQGNITVVAGKPLDLGKLVWKPIRYGRQLWDIGYPDRTGDKFFKGDGANYWLWGWNLRYALLFPNDITYTIGKSDYHKDWFFEEVPHATNLSFVNPKAKDPANQRFGWVKSESLEQYPQTNQRGPWAIYGSGRTTVWTIKFNMKKSVHGEAFLRVALAGVNGLQDGLAVGVNGKSVGAIGDGSNPDNARLITTNTIRYNSDKGLSEQRTLRFDAALLRRGENEITFTVPGGDLQSGVVWDYLRLELNEN
ncbi:MAG: polysaccharide lyase family protein [Edaphobacter sp.]|jgi:rhamnogalacturonan endolyase